MTATPARSHRKTRPRRKVTPMATSHQVYNPRADAVVFDTAGHLLDPEQRVTTDLGDPVTAAAVARGDLLDLGPEPEVELYTEPSPPTEEG